MRETSVAPDIEIKCVGCGFGCRFSLVDCKRDTKVEQFQRQEAYYPVTPAAKRRLMRNWMKWSRECKRAPIAT